MFFRQNAAQSLLLDFFATLANGISFMVCFLYLLADFNQTLILHSSENPGMKL
jgi:hypothetical protein